MSARRRSVHPPTTAVAMALDKLDLWLQGRAGAAANSPAKPPAMPERIEAVLQLRELCRKVIRSLWGTARPSRRSQCHRIITNRATWECKYHIVFTPKYRKKVLFGQIRRHLGTVFRELAQRKECKIEEGHLMPDHVSIC